MTGDIERRPALQGLEHHSELSVMDVVVSAITDEAAGVKSLTLARGDGAPLPSWEPGAHVDVLLPDGIERQYSLCGDLDDLERWQLAVLREPESRGGSAWLHEQLRPGDVLRVRGPRNNFPLVDAGAYILIAGGIGVTPLLPMVERLQASGRAWKLVYGGRRRASMAFVKRLGRHEAEVTTWPEDEHGLLPLASLLEPPQPGVAVYCCGPEPLLAAVEAQCETWPQGALHIERFAPRPDALEGANTAFEVVLERSGTTVNVRPDESIIDALAAIGVHVPTSCREGTCGTCETEVIEGDIDHRDSLLSEEERDESETMMLCCSRARSGRIVLDL